MYSNNEKETSSTENRKPAFSTLDSVFKYTIRHMLVLCA